MREPRNLKEKDEPEQEPLYYRRYQCGGNLYEPMPLYMALCWSCRRLADEDRL